jgi:hypothetical protein
LGVFLITVVHDDPVVHVSAIGIDWTPTSATPNTLRATIVVAKEHPGSTTTAATTSAPPPPPPPLAPLVLLLLLLLLMMILLLLITLGLAGVVQLTTARYWESGGWACRY